MTVKECEAVVVGMGLRDAVPDTLDVPVVEGLAAVTLEVAEDTVLPVGVGEADADRLAVYVRVVLKVYQALKEPEMVRVGSGVGVLVGVQVGVGGDLVNALVGPRVTLELRVPLQVEEQLPD